MSDTIRYRPWAEPGFAGVTFLPKITDAPEPGGVNWITWKSSAIGEVGVETPAEAGVELLGARDIRDRDDDDLELHVRRTDLGGIDCYCHGFLLLCAG